MYVHPAVALHHVPIVSLSTFELYQLQRNRQTKGGSAKVQVASKQTMYTPLDDLVLSLTAARAALRAPKLALKRTQLEHRSAVDCTGLQLAELLVFTQLQYDNTCIITQSLLLLV